MHLLKLLENQMQKRAVGTLTLGKKKGFCEVFVEQESLYLGTRPFSGRIATDKLVQLGIPGRRIPLEKLETLIQSTDLKRHLLPEALLDAGVISRHEFPPLVEAQLCEEIIDLLLRNSGSFHFQDGYVPEHMLQCDIITTRAPVPLPLVIEELQRRMRDSAHYETLIPSQDEVFVVTEKGLALRQGQKTHLALEVILRLIDGFRDLRSLVNDTFLYEFEVISWVALALEEGYIKKTLLPELQAFSAQGLGPGDVERALPHFKNAVKYGVDELAARERLAAVYENAGRADDAVIQYNFIGDAFYRMQKPGKAIKAYQRALFLKPDEILITDKITKIYREAAEDELANRNTAQAVHLLEEALKMRPEDQEILAGLLELLVPERNLREISKISDWIIAHSRKVEKPELAINVCRQIIHRLPTNAAFRKKLVNLYVDSGRKAEACTAMEQLARMYLSRGQAVKAQELLEKLRRMGCGSQGATSLKQQIVASRPRPRKPRRKVSWVQRTFLGLVAFLLVYQVLGYLTWSEIRDHSVSAQSEAPVPKETASILPGPREMALRTRISQCRWFLRCFPFHIFTKDARGLLETTETEVEYLEDLRRKEAQRILGRAEEALREGRKETGLALVEELLKLDSRDQRHRQAEQLKDDLLKITRSAEQLLSDARKLEERARRANDAASWRRAFRAYRSLLETYPESRYASRVRLPIWIESIPSEAEVRKAGGTQELLGRTPFVYWHRSTLSILEDGISVVLRARGCEPLQSEITEAHGEDGLFLLPRKADWGWDLDSPVEKELTVGDDMAACGTTGGRLYIFDLESRRPVEGTGLSGESLLCVLRPPVVTGHGVITAWNNGDLLHLPVEKGSDGRWSKLQGEARRVRLYGLPGTDLLTLRTQPHILVGTSRSTLEEHSAETLERLRSLPLPGEPTCLTPLSRGHVLVGTREGTLLKVDLASGEVQSIILDLHAPVSDAAVFGDLAVALLADRRLVPCNLDTRGRENALELPEGSSVLLAPEESRIYILHSRGQLQVYDPGSTSRAGSRELQVQVRGLYGLPGALGIVHPGDSPGRDALLIVRRQNLAPLWATRVDGRITQVSGQGPHVVVAVMKDGPDGEKTGRLEVFHFRPE